MVEAFHVTCVTGLTEARVHDLAAGIPRFRTGGARAAAEFIRQRVAGALRAAEVG